MPPQCGLSWGGIVAKVVHAGNRTQVERYRQVAGTAFADTEDYTVNDLNQVTEFDNTQRALFIGKGALTEDTLKLDFEGGTPTHVNRAHDYFYDSREKAMTSDGWVSGVLLRDDVPEALADIPLRAAEEKHEFDADGNPETSGSTTFVYDAENRLIRWSGTGFEAEFAYDYLNRRARSKVRQNSSEDWQEFDHLYVGGLLAGLLHSNGEEYERHLFTWGLDRSGTMGGAGGIGGLLEVTVGGEFGEVPVRADYLAAADGLGNVVAYINRADGVREAEFEYSPFGETVRAKGDLAQFGDFIFPLRHQSKFSSAFYLGYELPVHELYDYGQRSYEPTLGRFLNRDPIGIAGGANLYAYLGGTAFGAWDAWGWSAWDVDIAPELRFAPGLYRYLDPQDGHWYDTNGNRINEYEMFYSPPPPEDSPDPLTPVAEPPPPTLEWNSWIGVIGPSLAIQSRQLRLQMHSNSGVGARSPIPPSRINLALRDGLLSSYGVMSGGGSLGSIFALSGQTKISAGGRMFNFSTTVPTGAWTPSGGSTAMLFVSEVSRPNVGLRLDFGHNAATGAVDAHWNQRGVSSVFGLQNHATAGAASSMNAIKLVQVGSRAFIVTGVAVSVAEVAVSPNPVREAGRQVSGWAGATAGGVAFGAAGIKGGAAFGTLIAPGPGTAIGGTVGGFFGGLAGGVVGWFGFTSTYDHFVPPGP